MGAGLKLLGRLGGVDDLPVAVDGAVAIEALGALPDIPNLDGLEGAGALIQALAPVHLVHRLGLVLRDQGWELKDLSVGALGLSDAHPLLVGHHAPGAAAQTRELQASPAPCVVARHAPPGVADRVLRVLAAANALGVTRPALLPPGAPRAHHLVLEVGSLRTRDDHPLTLGAAPTAVIRALGRALVQTVVGGLVVDYLDVGVLVVFLDHNLLPVDGVHIAEEGVLLDPYATVHDVGEAGEADPDHVLHLVDGEGVELDQLVASDDGEAGKDALEAVDLVRPVQEDKVSDLHEVGQRVVAETLHLVHSGGDGDGSLNHRAVLVLNKARHPGVLVLVVDVDVASVDAIGTHRTLIDLAETF